MLLLHIGKSELIVKQQEKVTLKLSLKILMVDIMGYKIG
jgi:hypothetical protein